MRREPLSNVLEILDFTWVKRGDVWEGPPVSDPTPYLPLARELGRIEVRGDRYVMVDPWITLRRFCWEDGDVEITHPEGAPLDDAAREAP